MSFLPIITLESEANTTRESEKIVKATLRVCLSFKNVAESIAAYKTNKSLVTGHKVLDDHEAVRLILKNSPEHLRDTIVAQKVAPYRMTQLMNQALRREWEMVKGKLTGQPSADRLKRLAKQQFVSGAAAEVREWDAETAKVA